MKNILKAALAASITALLLGGCSQALPDMVTVGQTSRTARAVIRVGEASPASESGLSPALAGEGAGDIQRTLMPGPLTQAEVSKYVITLTKDPMEITWTGNTEEKKAEITGTGVVFTLADGEWGVTVEAFRSIDPDGAGDSPAKEYKTAKGTATLTVTEHGPNTVHLTLKPIEPEDAEGTPGIFSWNLILPAGVTLTTFTLGGEAVSPLTGSLEKTAGTWDLFIVLRKTGTEQIAGIYEQVYIYPGLTTAADYDFTTGAYDLNFAAKVLIAGTLSITRTGSAGDTAAYTVQAYSNAACTQAISGAAASIGAANTSSGSVPWLLGIPVANYTALSPKTVYLKAGFTAANYAAVSQPVTTVSDLGLQGTDTAAVSISIIRRYTVTYHINGGSGTTPASQTADAGSSVTLAGGSGLSKSGYIFGGWNTKSDGTGANYPGSSSYTPTGDITLYAHWWAPAPGDWGPAGGRIFQFYSQWYEVAPASATAGTYDFFIAQTKCQTLNYGGYYGWMLPDSDVLNAMYQNKAAIGGFENGWYWSGEIVYDQGIKVQNFSDGTRMIEAYRPSYYARAVRAFTPSFIVPTYVVTYDINGGSGTTPDSQTAGAGSIVTLAGGSGFSKSGSIFSGWNTKRDGTGTNYSGSSSYTLSGDITLYARWMAPAAGNQGPAGGIIFRYDGTWYEAAPSNATSGTYSWAQADAVCATLTYGGYDDWMLPNIGVLTEMYQNKASIGGFESDWYWSSSVIDDYGVNILNFSNGTPSVVKYGNCYIRGVRTFTP